MLNTLICILIGVVLGVWFIFALKHAEFIVVSIFVVFALRFLFGSITNG